jgi:hypothetical protein
MSIIPRLVWFRTRNLSAMLVLVAAVAEEALVSVLLA